MTAAAALQQRDTVATNTTPTFAGAAAGALYDAIASSMGTDALGQLARALWRGYGEGAISDDDAGFLQSLIDRRRPLAPARRGVAGRAIGTIASRFAPRRRRVLTDPQKQAARERRRDLGSMESMPSPIKKKLTEGERAVSTIIAGEVKATGNCDFPIDKIAALAGVCRTTVQNTIHELRRLCLITVTERPRPGRKNLTNIIRIVSPEWLAWIKRGPGANRSKWTGSNSVLRSKNKGLSQTKSIYIKKRNGDEMKWRGSGRPETSRRGYGPPETGRVRRE